MGGKGREHRARDHPPMCRGWEVRVGSGRGGEHGEGCVRWSGLDGEEEGRRGHPDKEPAGEREDG